MAEKPKIEEKGYKVKISDAAALAAELRAKGGERHGDDYAERIGKSFLNNVLSRVADGTLSPATGGGGSAIVDEVGRMVDVVDKLRGKGKDNDDDEDRPRRRRRRRSDDDDDDDYDDRRSPRRGGSDGMDGRLVIQVVDKLGATTRDVVENMTKNQQNMMDRLEKIMDRGDDRKRGREPSKFEELAYAALAEKLNGGNPLETTIGILQAGEKFRETLGIGGGRGEDDLDKFIARERLRIEEKRTDADIEDMRETREMRSGLVAALPQLVGRRKAAMDDDEGDEDESKEAPRYRYSCDACKHRWISTTKPEPGAIIGCPKCKQQLEIGGIGDSA